MRYTIFSDKPKVIKILKFCAEIGIEAAKECIFEGLAHRDMGLNQFYQHTIGLIYTTTCYQQKGFNQQKMHCNWQRKKEAFDQQELYII